MHHEGHLPAEAVCLGLRCLLGSYLPVFSLHTDVCHPCLLCCFSLLVSSFLITPLLFDLENSSRQVDFSSPLRLGREHQPSFAFGSLFKSRYASQIRTSISLVTCLCVSPLPLLWIAVDLFGSRRSALLGSAGSYHHVVSYFVGLVLLKSTT